MIRRHRGVALISVMLILAVATTLAYQVATRHTLSIAQSRQLLDGSQVRQYALGGEEYARQILYADWLDEETRGNDTLLESWALGSGNQADEPGRSGGERQGQGRTIAGVGRSARRETAASTGRGNLRKGAADAPDATQETLGRAFAIENGSLAIRIDDLSARLNLNAVVGDDGAENFARFRRLLDKLGMDASIADAWHDWIDDDQDIHGTGAEDADYLLREVPRRAANQPATHLSELLVVAAMSMEQFELLRPHVAVLPVDYLRVNVNTASATVLQALVPNFDPTETEMLTAEPREFESVETVVSEHAALAESVDVLAVTSEFFRIRVRAEIEDSRSDLVSVVHRNSSSGALTLLSRNFGESFDAGDEQALEEEAVLQRVGGQGGM